MTPTFQGVVSSTNLAATYAATTITNGLAPTNAPTLLTPTFQGLASGSNMNLSGTFNLVGNLSNNGVLFPASGCTDLGSTTAVVISGATLEYIAYPTNNYTVTVAAAAARVPYEIIIFSTNTATISTLKLLGSWTTTGTNDVGVSPSTNTVWYLKARGL